MGAEIKESAYAEKPEQKEWYKTLEKKSDLPDDSGNKQYKSDLPDDSGNIGVKDIKAENIDANGKIYTKDGKLLPITTYELNENVYATDDQGRIKSCESTPQRTPENPRDINAQTSVGSDDRKDGDQGGHIIGRDIGGDSGIGNLIPMDSRINQSDYRRMENDIKRALDEGKEPSIKIQMDYDGSSERPNKIIATVTIDGKNIRYTFDNDLDDSLLDKLRETCSESDVENIQSVLDETGGQVSSTKEEFDADGTLKKTTILITYTGDDGKNYRRSVVINHNGGALQ